MDMNYGPKYHKINTIYKRDMDNNGLLMPGHWSQPEFEYLQHSKWLWTEKVDGTNIRVHWDGATLAFGGRKDTSSIPAHLVQALRELFDSRADAFMRNFNDSDEIDVTLYGEGYGPKIQKCGGLYRKDPSFVLFDVRVGHWWLKREDVVDLSVALDLDVVPTIGLGSLHEAAQYAMDGFPSKWNPELTAEGLIATPLVPLQTRSGQRIITKIKHKDFRRLA